MRDNSNHTLASQIAKKRNGIGSDPINIIVVQRTYQELAAGPRCRGEGDLSSPEDLDFPNGEPGYGLWTVNLHVAAFSFWRAFQEDQIAVATSPADTLHPSNGFAKVANRFVRNVNDMCGVSRGPKIESHPNLDDFLHLSEIDFDPTSPITTIPRSAIFAICRSIDTGL